MRNLPSLRSLRSTLLALGTLGAASSLLGCAGDDTNPPAPVVDAGPGDAAKATDGATPADGATATDSGAGTDTGTETDTGTATDAGEPG